MDYNYWIKKFPKELREVIESRKRRKSTKEFDCAADFLDLSIYWAFDSKLMEDLQYWEFLRSLWYALLWAETEDEKDRKAGRK